MKLTTLPGISLMLMMSSAGAAEGQVFNDLSDTAPQLQKYTASVLENDLWKRPQLAPRERSMVTLAALIADNQSAQLPQEVNRALDNGVKPVELSGIITQLAFYTGWPGAMSAVSVARKIFQERNIDAASLTLPDGDLLPVDEESEAKRAAAVRDNVTPTAPELAKYTDEVLFADLWRRKDLSPRDRSLVTMAALITRGQSEQLTFHLNRAMDNGLTQEEAGEVITQLAFYAGWPDAMSAITVAKKVFETRKKIQ